MKWAEPPRNLLPFEIENYNTFLIREKADGILINNTPHQIKPESNDISNRQIKGEFIDEINTYLIFDVDISDTNIQERYELLRKSHPITKNNPSYKINNLNDFINSGYVIIDTEIISYDDIALLNITRATNNSSLPTIGFGE